MTAPEHLADRPGPAATLPPFPWDTIAEYRAVAEAHPDGIINLSVGTPVDPVAVAVRNALADASDAPGYPQVRGTAPLREAYAAYVDRAHGVDLDPENVLPTIGSKEFVAALPAQLGLRSGETVVTPPLAYPTYDVGARLVGARVVRADTVTELDAADIAGPALIWLNSPSNPTGKVLPPDRMARLVSWARAHGAVIASDECYLDLGWETEPISVLHPDVCGGDHRGLLAVHSLSKRSNLAGYRLGFVSGDPALVGRLTELRKHLGLMVPSPIQHAGVAALSDDAPVLAQRSRYAERREVLGGALQRAGFTIGESEAGLYLWCTRRQPALDTVAELADQGILVAPGTFYGPTGAEHVRVALTGSDERIAAAAARLSH